MATRRRIDMATSELDQQRQEAFAARMLDVLNGASLVFLTSVGHKTGLFDAMSQLPPSSSEEIAEAAGLDDRYVRECLGGMVVGGFVEYQPDDRRYVLRPEHAAFLTRAAGHENFAVFAQYYPLIGQGRGAGDRVVPDRWRSAVFRVSALPGAPG
jgi:hypothetical protein